MLGRPNTRSASPTGERLDLGFRRISLVRVWAGAGATRYEVDGVMHRHPVTQPVTVSMAARLVAAGVPLVVRAAGDKTEGGAAC